MWLGWDHCGYDSISDQAEELEDSNWRPPSSGRPERGMGVAFYVTCLPAVVSYLVLLCCSTEVAVRSVMIISYVCILSAVFLFRYYGMKG